MNDWIYRYRRSHNCLIYKAGWSLYATYAHLEIKDCREIANADMQWSN